MGRDCRYCPASGLTDSLNRARAGVPQDVFEGSGKLMKKVALTVAVLALGLAACNKNNADTNAANETAVENNAAYDTNTATDNAAAAADTALNAAGNAVENAGNAVENASDAVHNAAENATH